MHSNCSTEKIVSGYGCHFHGHLFHYTTLEGAIGILSDGKLNITEIRKNDSLLGKGVNEIL